MVLPFWGQLEKAQDDDQSVEDAIDAAIAAHNADSEAHLGTGGSLEAHKTEDMIDHPAGSVASDKLAQAHLIITAFESIDGWEQFTDGSGDIIQDIGNVTLTTGATNGSDAWLYAVPSSWIPFDTAKQFFWKAVVKFAQDTQQFARFGIGCQGDGDGLSGAGFEVEDGVLSSYTEDNESVSRHTISGIDITEWHIYEVRYDPSTETFYYYIDGGLVYSVVRSFTVTQDDGLAIFRIHNQEAAAKFMYVTDMVVQVER